MVVTRRGRLARVRAAVQALRRTTSRVTRAAPAQGEHSAEVLREAGYDDAAIAALAAAGVRQGFLTGRFGRRPPRRRTAPTGSAATRAYSGSAKRQPAGDVVRGHLRRVGAPEELVADRERRHAEHAARDRLVGVAAQLVLHLRPTRCAHRRRARRARRRAPPIRSAGPGSRPSRQTKRKIRCTASAERVAGDRKAQQRQRVERMLGRKLERDAQPFRLPDAEAVGERALGRDLGRPLLAVRVEQRREQHRPVAQRQIARRERGELLALQVRERRDEVEVPVGDRHARKPAPAPARRAGSAGQHARGARRASSTLHAAISSSVRKQPMHRPRRRVHRADATMHGEATLAIVAASRFARRSSTAPHARLSPRRCAEGAPFALGTTRRAPRAAELRVERARDARTGGGRGIRDEASGHAQLRHVDAGLDAEPVAAGRRRPRSRRCRSRPSRTDSRPRPATEQSNVATPISQRRVDVGERLAVGVVEVAGERAPPGTRAATAAISACVLPARADADRVAERDLVARPCACSAAATSATVARRRRRPRTDSPARTRCSRARARRAPCAAAKTGATRSRLSAIEQLMFLLRERLRRGDEHGDLVGLRRERRLEALHVRRQHRVADARLAADARHHVGGVGHLRHPFRRHEATSPRSPESRRR